MRKTLSAAMILAVLAAGEAQASVACFKPGEADAAYLRNLQQAYNITALSCARSEQERGSLSQHYNEFVGRFGAVLKENSRLLLAHFASAGGQARFDQWMTVVANDAAQRAVTDPSFCQTTAASLEKALTLQPAEFKTFATTTGASTDVVPLCPDRKPAVRAARSHKVRHLKEAAVKKTAAATPQ